METINDVLHFLNYLDFNADLRSVDFSNFSRVQTVLTDNFQDVDSEQLIHMLGVIDDLRILFSNQNFNEVCRLLETLREIIFTLFEKKTIEEEVLFSMK